jgi:hypothetical protein
MMPKRAASLAALAALLALSGCSPTLPAGLDLGFEVPGGFSISAGEPGRLALHNQGSAAVHLPMGMYVSRERWDGSSWVSLGSWFIVDGIGPSLRVAPGESLENQIHPLYFQEAGPGLYRFRYEIFSDRELRRPLPPGRRVSASFEVGE